MPEEQREIPPRTDGRPPPPVHTRVAWEPRDASFVGVLWVAVSTLLIGIVVLLCLRLFIRTEGDALQAEKASAFPLAPQPSAQLPAEPRLEPIDRMEQAVESNPFQRLLDKERRLHAYGETSDAGFVQVPIERAIEFAVRKLPARAAPPPDARRFGLVDAGEPNSGRMFVGGDR